MPLNAGTRLKVVKLLGLSGSSHDAEALSAIRKAGELVRSAGASWADVVSPPALMLWREPRPGDWLDAVAICICLPGAPLTTWDKKFLISISQRDTLTEKQEHQLTRILDNCRLHACCAA